MRDTRRQRQHLSGPRISALGVGVGQDVFHRGVRNPFQVARDALATNATRAAAHRTAATPAERDDPASADVDVFLVSSRVLGEDVWLAPHEVRAERLERELRAEGDRRLVFTVDELLPLADMLEADRRALLAALARIKRTMPGAILERVTPAETADA